jgi:hypothetical protein
MACLVQKRAPPTMISLQARARHNKFDFVFSLSFHLSLSPHNSLRPNHHLQLTTFNSPPSTITYSKHSHSTKCLILSSRNIRQANTRGVTLNPKRPRHHLWVHTYTTMEYDQALDPQVTKTQYPSGDHRVDELRQVCCQRMLHSMLSVGTLKRS